MIDEFFTRRAIPATGTAVRLSAGFLYRWFKDFRWIECCAAVGAAFGAGMTVATTMGLPESIARKIGIFGAVAGFICYIRSPKTRWDCTDDINDEGSLRQPRRGK